MPGSLRIAFDVSLDPRQIQVQGGDDQTLKRTEFFEPESFQQFSGWKVTLLLERLQELIDLNHTLFTIAKHLD